MVQNGVQICISNAKEECSSVTKIFEKEVKKNVKKNALEFVSTVPVFHAVKKQLYSARHNALGIETLPK